VNSRISLISSKTLRFLISSEYFGGQRLDTSNLRIYFLENRSWPSFSGIELFYEEVDL
jgi:hypothetical protein